MTSSSLINGKTTTTTHQTTTLPITAQIEAVQSIPPTEVTVPRAVRRVSSQEGSPPGLLSLLGGCLHVVLYYNNNSNKAGGDGGDQGSVHAGWVKESLAGVLTGEPLLAGRLQRGDEDRGEGGFSVVSNDAGVRLVEARIGVALADFLAGSAEVEAETELVFWKDVAETDPQFSPLFYVQVTKFKCGGYSFGISCSILLADLVLKGNFFKKWAEIHNNLLYKNGVIEKPLFYLPNLKKESISSTTISNIFSTNASKDSGQTVLFNVTTSAEQSVDNEYYLDEFSTIATTCVQEEESRLGNKPGSDLVLLKFPIEPENNVKIEKLSRLEMVAKTNKTLADIGRPINWEIFGGNELQFLEGNRPVRVSHWIGSVSSTELVMGIPCCYGDEKDKRGLRIIVKFPN